MSPLLPDDVLREGIPAVPLPPPRRATPESFVVSGVDPGPRLPVLTWDPRPTPQDPSRVLTGCPGRTGSEDLFRRRDLLVFLSTHALSPLFSRTCVSDTPGVLPECPETLLYADGSGMHVGPLTGPAKFRPSLYRDGRRWTVRTPDTLTRVRTGSALWCVGPCVVPDTSRPSELSVRSAPAFVTCTPKGRKTPPR